MDILTENLITAMIGSGFGAFLGYLGGLKVNKIQYKNRLKEHKVKRLKETLFLLKNLEEEINHNIELLQEMDKEFSSDWSIFYHTDINVWEATKELRIVLIKNPTLLKKLNKFYYQIQHLQRKIDAQFNIYYNSKVVIGKDKDNNLIKIEDEIPLRFREIVNSILLHIPHLLRLGSSASNLITNDIISIKKQLDKL